MKKNMSILFVCAAVIASFGASSISWATSAGNKLSNDAEDAKRDTKKGARKLKKNVRNATGHGSFKKDAEDKYHDVKDDMSAEGNKLKK